MTPSQQRVTASCYCTSHTKGRRCRNLAEYSFPATPPPLLTRGTFRPLLERQMLLEHTETKVPLHENSHTHKRKQPLCMDTLSLSPKIKKKKLSPCMEFPSAPGWYQARGCRRHSLCLSIFQGAANQQRPKSWYLCVVPQMLKTCPWSQE